MVVINRQKHFPDVSTDPEEVMEIIHEVEFKIQKVRKGLSFVKSCLKCYNVDLQKHFWWYRVKHIDQLDVWNQNRVLEEFGAKDTKYRKFLHVLWWVLFYICEPLMPALLTAQKRSGLSPTLKARIVERRREVINLVKSIIALNNRYKNILLKYNIDVSAIKQRAKLIAKDRQN